MKKLLKYIFYDTYHVFYTLEKIENNVVISKCECNGRVTIRKIDKHDFHFNEYFWNKYSEIFTIRGYLITDLLVNLVNKL